MTSDWKFPDIIYVLTTGYHHFITSKGSQINNNISAVPKSYTIMLNNKIDQPNFLPYPSYQYSESLGTKIL